MGKLFLYVISVLLISMWINAQTIHSRAKEVADAEIRFAKKARQSNTREAFLEYYADNVIVFREGAAVNGKEDWKKKKPDSSELWWHPVFADIAYSGDFGYTTGP